MRSPDNIALEFVAQDVRIATLNPARHGLTDPGKGLVPIQPAQLDDFSIEFEAWSVNWASRKPMVRETSSTFVAPRSRRTSYVIQIGLRQIP